MCKRIISLFLVFAIVSSISVACAVYEPEQGPDYLRTVLWMACQGDDRVGFRSFIDAFFSKSDSGCSSPSGFHSWHLAPASDIPVSFISNAFLVECSACHENYRHYLDGEDGSFSSEDLGDIYDTWTASASGGGGHASLGSGAGWTGLTYSPSELLSLPLCLDSSQISTFDSWVDDGSLLDHSEVGGELYTLGTYYSRYSYSEIYYFRFPELTFYTASFTVSSDGSYSVNLPPFLTSGYSSSSSESYGFTLYLDVLTGSSWSGVSSIFISCVGSKFSEDASFVPTQYSFGGSSGYTLTSNLLASNVYRLRFQMRNNPYQYLSGGGSGTYYGQRYGVQFSGPLSISANDVGAASATALSPSTRPAFYSSEPMKLVKTSDNTSSGSITNVYTSNIFNESTKVFTEPTTGQQYLCDGWRYDYVNPYRGYKLDIADGSYTYNGHPVNYVYLLYFDDSLLILGFEDQNWIDDIPSTATDAEAMTAMLQNAVFSDRYFYAIPVSSGSSSVASPFIFTETTTGQQYMVDGIKTIFDGSDRTICLDLVDGTYEYQGTDLSHIVLVYGDSSVLIAGHSDSTISLSDSSTWPDSDDALFTELHYYSVEVEGNSDQTSRILGWWERFKLWLGGKLDNLGSGGSDSASSSSGGFFGWLGDKVKTLLDGVVGGISSGLEAIIDGLMSGLASGLEYLVEHVIKAIVDLVLDVIRWLFSMVDGEAIHTFFGWFDDDNPYFDFSELEPAVAPGGD